MGEVEAEKIALFWLWKDFSGLEAEIIDLVSVLQGFAGTRNRIPMAFDDFLEDVECFWAREKNNPHSLRGLFEGF